MNLSDVLFPQVIENVIILTPIHPHPSSTRMSYSRQHILGSRGSMKPDTLLILLMSVQGTG